LTDIWAACAARASTVQLTGDIYRLVESQEQVATNSLVRTLAEQALLEDLIESSKPPLPSGTSGLHYLLATPFRYPPLPYGSRFGSRFEPGLFYAARTPATTLAESAYYRFVFWSGMLTPPAEALHTRHTMFNAGICTERGLQLQLAPFDEFRDELTHRSAYTSTQTLGTAMRAAGVIAFEYRSARDPQAGIDVALFTPEALASRSPNILDEWLCETDGARVGYYSRHGGGFHEFPLGTFTVDGRLPMPAV
jgi:hypothetical protein